MIQYAVKNSKFLWKIKNVNFKLWTIFLWAIKNINIKIFTFSFLTMNISVESIWDVLIYEYHEFWAFLTPFLSYINISKSKTGKVY